MQSLVEPRCRSYLYQNTGTQYAGTSCGFKKDGGGEEKEEEAVENEEVMGGQAGSGQQEGKDMGLQRDRWHIIKEK